MLLEKTNRPDEAVASYNLAIKFRPTLAGNKNLKPLNMQQTC